MNDSIAPIEPLALRGDDGMEIYAGRWLPGGSPTKPVRASIVIAHGMGEHIGRYAKVATQLADAGYAVYGKDHRGHGRTADPNALGDMGEDGWNKSISDTRNLVELAQQAHPRAATVLLGHSMGAMLAQQFVYRYGYLLDAAVLSGSPGFAHPLTGLISLALAQFERLRLGGSGHSPVLQSLLFGKSNEPFDGPSATGFEWLSRDSEQVARYVADDFCGFVLRTGSLVQLFNGAREAARANNVHTIAKSLPIYVFSGSEDPVHKGMANLQRMLNQYRAAGLKTTLQMYPGGRHEMFNETNSEQVMADMLSWLDKALT